MGHLTFNDKRYSIASIILGSLAPIILIGGAGIDNSPVRLPLAAALPIVGFACGILSVKTRIGAVGIFLNVLMELFVVLPFLFPPFPK
jgi:hypothetical protein